MVVLGMSFFAPAEVHEFRLDQDRLWLVAEDEPLPRLFEHFAAAGIRVEIDPAVQKTVSGTWRNCEVESVLKVILSTSNYLLDWQRESGPLGTTIRLTRVRIYSDGKAGEAKPLSRRRRIETSPDGSQRFMAREILIGFGPGASLDTLRGLLARLGGTVIASNPELNNIDGLDNLLTVGGFFAIRNNPKLCTLPVWVGTVTSGSGPDHSNNGTDPSCTP